MKCDSLKNYNVTRAVGSKFGLLVSSPIRSVPKRKLAQQAYGDELSKLLAKKVTMLALL